MASNMIGRIRPDATFASYEPQTPEQEYAKQYFEGFAAHIVGMSDQFNKQNNPFPHAAMYVLVGQPGTGKTHLMEAFVNAVIEGAPSVAASMYLHRGNFTHATMSAIFDSTFDKKPIILIDDLYAQHQSIGSLHPKTDIAGMMNFITYIYDNRALVITTSNFPVVKGILPLIQGADNVGRITSRCAEILTARAGEIEITGPDYRAILAQRALEAKGDDKLPPFPGMKIG